MKLTPVHQNEPSIQKQYFKFSFFFSAIWLAQAAQHGSVDSFRSDIQKPSISVGAGNHNLQK
jgi:hypothetical protein